MEDRELTFGEKAVGITFNPSGNEDVEAMKGLYANLINQLDDLRNSSDSSPETTRLASIAITEAQGAQMWAVKAITWK